ncbi:inositol monophosphatase [Brachybacterium ginsengisoli]|uniref:Inositol monophosphatase n=1 Tax=Brachybacterium ginsengisoli TaxID=1331682 RepID=A0A291H0L5_9MICO|nr:inositol monophosphatase family protein [Brachybacterium ginsengisoli]ATG56019.1 inositol monophosphatase [Brachybacterium ginsengisoli]
MDLRSAADLAITLARQAGDFAVAEQDTARIEAKGAGSDLVTHVDREAERRIVAALREQYPEHSILGEEEGEQGAAAGARHRWLIDPLDGTNNYVLGLDVYGVCITLCEGEQPVMAVVHDSPRRRTCWAIAGQGAWLTLGEGQEPRRLDLGAADPLDRTTIAFTQGYEVGHDDERRNALFAAMERGTKRVLRSWAPSSDWGLLAAGRLGAMVAYRNEIWDRVGGTLITLEAGGELCTDPSGELIVVGKPQTVRELDALLGVTGPTTRPEPSASR